MGKRSDYKKRKNDSYDTPNSATSVLIKHVPQGCRFIEPCAGKGDMVDFLVANGLVCVDYFDIEPRRRDIKQYDAFEYPISNYNDCDMIITNPPWTRTKQSGYLMHSLIDLWAGIRPTALLFDADWAHTKQAAEYLEYCTKIISIGRVSWMENGVSGMDNSCWYIFDKQSNEDTIFIGRDS